MFALLLRLNLDTWLDDVAHDIQAISARCLIRLLFNQKGFETRGLGLIWGRRRRQATVRPARVGA